MFPRPSRTQSDSRWVSTFSLSVFVLLVLQGCGSLFSFVYSDPLAVFHCSKTIPVNWFSCKCCSTSLLLITLSFEPRAALRVVFERKIWIRKWAVCKLLNESKDVCEPSIYIVLKYHRKVCTRWWSATFWKYALDARMLGSARGRRRVFRSTECDLC